jgi:hypothetical protein
VNCSQQIGDGKNDGHNKKGFMAIAHVFGDFGTKELMMFENAIS